ncbi:NADP-dependent phosphogluconate dehydrogenase [Shouchella clausii]|uniref:6-phosphogluconate dehydrogenase, decarboxylating n=1 Tax=Shouchella clausii TaxID=79880 RepID=A0A268S0Q7_SHOCL|nr:NADP-dependent phosphogluconate dehydrogenase [Shouchella clausii]PAD42981.1 phosphogluconate dehydrogenase (NADP(+)-dependent, decarboxylating) [Bacillus sp. 7520-S]MBU8597686.1 NADP-dependent phosphogluconate dehydrogenase [Shouchella clausii]MCY1104236.1 NADP-dependent phosphogluconate dehydrogenase [Shouchella clausii]MEB5479563.1 NADP-dependent phosphogluconate dehydrogenase [Shouchella clausii]MED4176239.1 NADP-dependent phosphogluconate dehydrogenase [Shouchella clausii]
MAKQNIGVVGVGVMGRSLALNFESKGFSVSLYDVSEERIKEILDHNKDKRLVGTFSLEEFVHSLEKPRKIMLMVQAGQVTDQVIDSLIPLLDKKDILIDGGNTYYTDTIRRSQTAAEHGIHFIGTGVSGGEEGALKGPSIMPGGQKEAYELVKPMFEKIAAQVNGEPCTTYIGPDGAGHYVKMVHNGIEYGDMQLICEAYSLLVNVLGLNAEELHSVFKEWNEGELDSYLIEITADIFTKVDEETGKPIVDVILDTAGQKGTGKWTSKSSLDLGVPLPVITESVFARFLSAMKEERVKASQILSGPEKKPFTGNKQELIERIRQALYFSKVLSYAQGFSQLKSMSLEMNWNLQYGEIAKIFRGGCIIRAAFLQNITDAFARDANLDNLLLDPYFENISRKYQQALREVVALAVEYGIPVPGFSSAISYYDSYRSERLPANLLQAQRDYFGAHTYQRIDKEGVFHTNWLD